MWIYPPAIEEQAHPAKCRGCNAAIIWVVTKARAKAPINADFQILETRKWGDVELVDIRQEDSHFATCPKREQFKRRKP